MNQKRKKYRGYNRISYSDYCQFRHQRIPDVEILKQNEQQKLKIFQLIKDFDPDNIRDTDLLIFKSYFKQAECVKRIQKVLDEGLNELFKLEIFIQQQVQRNKYGDNIFNEFSYFNFNLEINTKLEYIESIYDQEIQSYFSRHKDTQNYKTYVDQNTKLFEPFINYLNGSVEQTENEMMKLQEKRRIWVKEEPIPKERTSWQLYNPFSYLIPEMDSFSSDIEENAKIQSKAEKAIQLTRQGYQSYKDRNYEDAVQKFDGSLICNPQLSYAYLGKAISLSQIYQGDEKSVDQQKIIKAFDKAVELEPKNFLFQLNRLMFYHNNRMTVKSFDIIFDMQDQFSQQQQQDYFQFQQLVEMIAYCPYRDELKFKSYNGNGQISDSDSDFLLQHLKYNQIKLFVQIQIIKMILLNNIISGNYC